MTSQIRPKVTRRQVLKGVACTATAAVVGASAVRTAWPSAASPAVASQAPMAGALAPAASLIVYDGRLPASVAFQSRQSGAALDVALEPARLWSGLRGALAPRRVLGATSWSDFVQVRGWLQESGLRVRSERRSGSLFVWEMSRTLEGSPPC